MSSAHRWGCPGVHSAFPHHASAWPTPFKAPSALPKGSWGCLVCSGLFLLLFSPPFLSPLLPDCWATCLFSRADPGYLPWVSKCWFLSPDLTLAGLVCGWRGEQWFVLLCLQERQNFLHFFPHLQEPVTVSSHVVTISSLTPATSYNCSVTTFSHNSPSIPTFIAVSTMGKEHFPAFFFLPQLQHLFLLAFQSCSW